MLAEVGAALVLARLEGGVSDAKAKPSKGLAKRIVVITRFGAVPLVTGGDAGGVVEELEVVAEPDVDGERVDEDVAEVDVVVPVDAGVAVAEEAPGDVPEAGVDATPVPASAARSVTTAWGAGIETKWSPPSLVRTISVQSRDPHGAVPSNQNSFAEMPVYETGWKPRGTRPPLGPS